MKTLLLGDISPAQNNNNELFRARDTGALFGNALSLFEGVDFALANLECALTESSGAIHKIGPALKACPETARVLKQIGVDACGLSNNHVFDFGVRGAEDTLRALEAAGLQHTGFGRDYEDSRKNLVVQGDGETVAIIAVCEHEFSYALEDRMGSRPFDEYDTMEDIRQAKTACDRVIVLYHGGKEYCQYPSPRLHRLCRAMARNGADVVLCQHSHCIGCYEKYEDCHILYGQGNFHFLMPSTQEVWYTGLAVKYDTRSHEIEWIPVRAEGCGIHLAAEEDRQQILTAFEARNEQLASGAWKAGWHEFCLSLKENYDGIVARAYAPGASAQDNEMFAHYLDCEAHTDVWRELNPTANQWNEK